MRSNRMNYIKVTFSLNIRESFLTMKSINFHCNLFTESKEDSLVLIMKRKDDYSRSEEHEGNGWKILITVFIFMPILSILYMDSRMKGHSSLKFCSYKIKCLAHDTETSQSQ